MKRAILQLIDSSVKGVDTYTHAGSTWLIFTNNLTWVVEYDSSNVLWYNYMFFQDVFNFVSIEVVKHQEYITEWFESRILKIKPTQNGVKHIKEKIHISCYDVEDTIQKGVKKTKSLKYDVLFLVEDVTQNGVKETMWRQVDNHPTYVDSIIVKGVKETHPDYYNHKGRIDGIILKNKK